LQVLQASGGHEPNAQQAFKVRTVEFPRNLVSAVISKAAEEAHQLRQNWLGPCHYLLAVVAEPSVATEALAELGVTHDHLAQAFGAMNTVNGRRIRYIKSKLITTNPAAHDVSGWARGFAAASGRRKPSPEDWLLAIVYGNNGMVNSVLHELGVSAATIVDALRRRGVRVPEFEPEEDRPWRSPRSVEVTKSEWQTVVDALSEKHPPGSEWQWGFNSRKDRPGKIQFSAEEGIDLEAIVAEALARKN
jgi:ATP-dependent Clp protease ATP-binding subunit ClpA